MSDQNDTKRLLKETVIKGIGLVSPRAKASIEAFPSLMELARRIAVPFQVVLAMLGLLAAFWYGVQWRNTSTSLSDRIQTSLKEKLDNTVWQHKGFAAYLLSDIEEKPAEGGSSEQQAVNSELPTKLRCIERIANNEANRKIIGSLQLKQEIDSLAVEVPEAIIEDGSQSSNPNPPADGQPTEGRCVIPIQKHIRFKIGGPTEGARREQAVMGDGDSDFLIFLPAMALHYDNDDESTKTSELKNLSYNSIKKAEGQITDGLRAALRVNPDIVRDLQFARTLSGKLKEFDNSLINGNEVVQSYFIAESGLILIRSKSVKSQAAFYEIQFPKAYYFPDRDYVLGALRGRDTQRLSALGFDYESEPYIDLGGHGIVRTYSKKIKLANGRYGVICLDVSRSILEGRIKERLDVLRTKGNPYQEWTIVVDESSIQGPNGTTGLGALPEDFQWFARRLLLGGDKAELLGRIASQQDVQQSKDTNVLRYTIPLSTKLDDDKRKVTLMLVTIDFERLWALQQRRLVYVCIGLMIFILVTLNIFKDSFLLRTEISELVQKLDRVMEHAKNPYARLNSENEFVAINDCFLRLLGYGNKQSLEYENWGAKPRTFMSILDEPSQKRYEESLRLSRTGAPTVAYTVNMYKQDKKMLRARVYGERIVFPTIKKGKYPQRFGILLDWSAIDPAYEAMLTQNLQRQVRIVDDPDGNGGKFEIQYTDESV